MSLVQLMRQHALAAAEAKNWQLVSSTLKALPQIVVRDPTPVTYARIRELYGEEVRQLIAASIRAIAKSNSPLAGEMEDLHTVMLNEQIGVRLDLDERQTMLTQIGAAAGWNQQLVSQIVALGRRTVSVSNATAEECQSAWQEAEAAQAAARLLGQRGALESALRSLPIDTIVGVSGLPTQQQVIDRIIDHLTTFGVTFGG